MDKIKNTISKGIVIGSGVLGGAFLGAILFYFFFGLIYLAVFGNGPATSSEECATGSGLAWLSILGGGLLGAILGYRASKNTKPYDVEDEGSAREKTS
jgi:hypothetical protein